MKYYIIAGEASGDLHASNLMKCLKEQDATANFRYWGGDLMQKQGGALIKHYRDLAFMGFIEVIFNLKTILNNIKFCKKDLQNYAPDVLILVDYPGFNMRIAPFAKKIGIPVHYYISPQLWAWKENRIKHIKKNVDAMYVILPFEKDFYQKKHHFPVHFVGHPLVDALAERQKTDIETFRSKHFLNEKPIIALLPGSRKQEISQVLKSMLSVVNNFSAYQFAVAGAPGQESSFYRGLIQNKKNVTLIINDTYGLLEHAYAALVTSGTATLETALFNVPQVVCYKGNWISYQIGKRFVNLKYICLVNLIMDKPVIKELIQNQLNFQNLKTHLQHILMQENRQIFFEAYRKLRTLLGNTGASKRVAHLIIKAIK